MTLRLWLVALMTSLCLSGGSAEAGQNVPNLPVHTHLIKAGEIVDPYYIGRQFKWRQPECRYRDCPWYVIESVTHLDHGPFIPEYDGGPRVIIYLHKVGSVSDGNGWDVFLDNRNLMVRGKECDD